MDHLPLLLKQVGTGDRDAVAALYRVLEKPVYRFIVSRLNDPFEAADILHDVFMEVCRSANAFEGRSKVQTWVFGIAYRKIIDQHRRRARQDVTDDLPERIDDDTDTEACILASQEAAHVRFCLEQLSAEHRSAISLAFYEDMAYGAIAQVTGVPEGTVKTRIFHAKKLLLHCLTGRISRGAEA